YNQVFGYYYEVTKSQLDKVPAYFVRKQTLQNAERFYTEELKDLEVKILTAQEKIIEIEKSIIENIRSKTIELIPEIIKLAMFSKELDLIQAFAKVSLEFKYSKPLIHEGYELTIKDGRHPVVERYSKENFIPNDTYLNEDATMYIITGPNMSGKSTYLRQVALIVLMAHMGCFVPASYAEIPLTDRIFSRIGASDDVTRGVSTFMAEMMETAEILRNATSKSLLILDEIGRGTSTTDGIAIAWACAEYIAANLKSKTLFATHYHELSEITKFLKTIKNYHMMVTEWDGRVVFMRKLKEGALNKSYGIHVAALSGIPDDVITRANEIAAQLENKENEILGNIRKGGQLRLFDNYYKVKSCKVCEILNSLDIDGISPREALNLLYKLKEESDKCLNS
ncbi:MAG: DNA mismatch repair protein MutS, partial [candidate division WOR-3 bacterium]